MEKQLNDVVASVKAKLFVEILGEWGVVTVLAAFKVQLNGGLGNICIFSELCG